MTLRKALSRTLRQGHPWIYREAIVERRGVLPGQVVAVADRQGREVAFGYFDAAGPIAVRVLDLTPIADATSLVRERLRTALAARRKRLDLTTTNAFRWVHGEGDRLPGIHVDVYADVACVRFDGEGSRAFYRELPALLRECGRDLPVREVIDRELRARHGGEIEVLEHGARFLVDLARGQKGGLFLDQRENRLAVARRAAGKSLLNLFGYSGGFAIQAARAGATRTDTVDIAGPALATARRNFERNGLALDRAGFHAKDAFAFLEGAIARGQTWDIVVSDPPSFAPSKHSLTAARRSYLRLHRLAAQVVGRSGLLAAASCSSHVTRAEFLTLVRTGVELAGRRFLLESYAGAGPDHPTLPVFPEGDYLKFALGNVE
ncbi:MAG: class I SAM-dependent rRNA methyltransferase [Deltaproteobacteria bacterium]|nr:class I SAM-dependent rRNA methyltransferase [Deltaproteobacteria bacterium]